MSSVVTTIPLESASISQSFTWTDLGQPAAITYPTLSAIKADGTPYQVGPTRTITYTYGGTSMQWLTGVSGYATSIGYHANGMISQIAHANGVTDVIGLDPSHMPRPSSISTTGDGTANDADGISNGGITIEFAGMYPLHDSGLETASRRAWSAPSPSPAVRCCPLPDPALRRLSPSHFGKVPDLGVASSCDTA